MILRMKENKQVDMGETSLLKLNGMNIVMRALRRKKFPAHSNT